MTKVKEEYLAYGLYMLSPSVVSNSLQLHDL